MASRQAAVITRADERRREGFDDQARGNASWFTFFSADATPTGGMSAGLMVIRPVDGVLKPHRHQQAEIYFVSGGEGVLTIDGVATAISAGSTAFIPGEAEHSLRNVSDVDLRIFYVFPTDRFADVVYRFTDEIA